MRTPKTLATSLLSLSAAALLALSAAGAASAAPAPGNAPTETSGVSSHTVVETGGAEYWTAERMRNAIPGDVLAEKAMQRSANSTAALNRPAEAGAPSTVEAQAPSLQAKEVQTKANASETPVKHIGKVFFTLGGANYVCSGNSVSSTNKSTVSTAGPLPQRGPGRLRHQVHVRPGLPQRRRTLRHVDGQGPLRPDPVELRRRHDVRHRLRGHEHPQRPDPLRRRGRLGRAVQRRPRPDLQGLRLPRGARPSTASPSRAAAAPPPTTRTTRSSTPRASPAT